jgi:SAM-dependent methyltransferase
VKNDAHRYGPLAGCYDGFTRDVDYVRWADYIETHFRKQPRPVKTVLDLACGTGTLSWLLAERGYEVIGVDLSPDMLSQAMEKTLPTSGPAPLFLCQPMEELDLYGTVDACICMLDSVNHVTEPALLRRAIARVHLFLEPGGLFLFDVLSPAHLEGLDGGLFLDETEDALCVWRTEYDKRRHLCTYAMDLFLREGGLWRREEELHQEYAYTADMLEDFLKSADFGRIRRHGALKMRPPTEADSRLFFTAHKKG